MKSKREISSENSRNTSFGLLLGIKYGSLVIISLFCLAVFAVFMIEARNQAIRAENREQYYLSPLRNELASHLCSQASFPETLVDCTSRELAISYGEMRQIAEFYASQQMTYAEITELIGEYETSCSLGEKVDIGKFRCMYQFDSSFHLIFVFDESQRTLVGID